MNTDLIVKLVIAYGSLFGLYLGAMAIWNEYKPARAEPKWSVTITDSHGLPIRKTEMSAKGVARLIKDIESGYLM